MTILRLAHAQFRERIRRPGYLVAVVFFLFFAYLMAPESDARFYYTLSLGQNRGIYNSAWLGMVLALATATLLALFGFYMVKGGIRFDTRTGVGEIMASTRISKIVYLASRTLSNFAYLVAVTAPMIAVAFLMQQIRGEDRALDLVALVSPFILVTLPPLLIVSALAILFETVPGLRSGFGNIAYLFLWGSSFAIMMEAIDRHDLFVFHKAQDELGAAASAVDPGYVGGFAMGTAGVEPPRPTFEWKGLSWTADDLRARFLWTLAAFLPLGLAIPLFNRFDPARRTFRRRVRAPAESRSGPSLTQRVRVLVALPLAPLASLVSQTRFGAMALAEFRIALRGMHEVWGWTGLGLFVACIASPLDVVREFLLTFCWLWPILLWSQLGVRERTYRTDQLLFSAPHPVRRQMLAAWLSGAAVALFISTPALVRFALAGQTAIPVCVLVASLFAPSLALLLGVTSRTSRLFEVVYLLLWYAGPLEKVPGVDFLCSGDPSWAQTTALIYLALTAASLAGALAIRTRQLRR